MILTGAELRERAARVERAAARHERDGSESKALAASRAAQRLRQAADWADTDPASSVRIIDPEPEPEPEPEQREARR